MDVTFSSLIWNVLFISFLFLLLVISPCATISLAFLCLFDRENHHFFWVQWNLLMSLYCFTVILSDNQYSIELKFFIWVWQNWIWVLNHGLREKILHLCRLAFLNENDHIVGMMIWSSHFYILWFLCTYFIKGYFLANF